MRCPNCRRWLLGFELQLKLMMRELMMRGAHVLIISKSKKADPHTVLARDGINAALGTTDPEDNWG